MDTPFDNVSDQRQPWADDISAATVREIERLCDRLFEDVIDDAGFRRLDELLAASAAARRCYLRYVRLHGRLAEVAGACDRVEARELGDVAASIALAHDLQRELRQQRAAVGRESSRRRTLRRFQVGGRPAQLAGAVAAALLIGVGLWRLPWGDKNPTVAAPDAPTSTSPAIAAAPRDGVRITKITDLKQPSANSAELMLGAELDEGELLRFGAGEVELTYPTGVRVTLSGPVDFQVEPTGGLLRRGGLLASVPEEGHGFTIATPTGKVVDLGTEFGVAVDDFGVSEVNVFRGKVEAFPQVQADSAGQKFELTQGRGLQWSDRSIVPLSADIRRFTSASASQGSPGLRPAALNGQPIYQPMSLSDERWRTLGAAQRVDDAVELARDDVGAPAYVISRDRFDPAEGPVHVVCDISCDAAAIDSGSALAILTRCSGQRGSPGSPSAELLATGVRGCVALDAARDESILETGVKLEADREVSKIAWDGLGRLTPHARYRVELCDDGIAVTLTVSRVDQPTVTKTVSCRSLFRGEENRVALEGPAAGRVAIHGVAVWQTPGAERLASSASRQETRPSEIALRLRAQEQFDQWAPEHAQLIVDDSFDQGLDEDRWTTLGEVEATGGAVALGRANPEQHIDTWQARPYLLTRESFDSAEAPLTVMGRIHFSENFLRGYGASFAVMTRASDLRGSGPGWEYSVLTTGVRVNFWPAAWDQQHSLEIHEKPNANTIALLATRALPISAQSRDYAFCVNDDGRRAELTVVDLHAPEIAGTISASTSTGLGPGRLAFECSWGSPVMLDDVRIYRSAQADATPAIEAE